MLCLWKYYQIVLKQGHVYLETQEFTKTDTKPNKQYENIIYKVYVDLRALSLFVSVLNIPYFISSPVLFIMNIYTLMVMSYCMRRFFM